MINERKLEKTKLLGYLIYIKYNGNDYESFDENPGLKSLKLEYKNRFLKHNINIFKGIQQAGRTDKGVSANENVLYIMTSKQNIDVMLQYDDVIKIEKCLPFIELPEYIKGREYIFTYDEDKITRNENEIQKLCENLSGNMDYSKFTTKKGKLLKNTIRNLRITYKNKSLYFNGDSFLPHQVRIMSSYILTGKLKELNGKYLTLNKIFFKKVTKDIVLTELEIDKQIGEYALETKNYIFVYTKDLSRSIGKNGKNLRKIQPKKRIIYKNIDEY
ncbi:pseudouridine synthase family protein [Caviibacter abscessus]|uniref:hypothetical protein n=1 Tax=Caviibacter abscessus TaxID=1766719 RepID=UPI00082B3F43|nr:hypothetical protein [Caviibacter abscessus]